MIVVNCTPTLVYCKRFAQSWSCFNSGYFASLVCFSDKGLLMCSYPYGHEELAVCEDIDQVCFQF